MGALQTREALGESRDVDPVGERVGTERGDLGERVEARAGDQPEAPEHPAVDVAEARATDEVELDARGGWRRILPRAPQPLSGHPQVRPDAERGATPAARRERQEEVLADPPHALEARAGQGLDGLRRRGAKEARRFGVGLDPADRFLFSPALQVAGGDLDLGKLRHRQTAPRIRAAKSSRSASLA